MPYTASRTLVISAASPSPPSSQPLSSALPRQWSNNRRVSLNKNPIPLADNTISTADSSPVITKQLSPPPKLRLNLASCPPMVRKKSGEVVKSSLKCKSAPSTPTCPKFVHFNTELEHVRLFLKGQTPTAVQDDPEGLDQDEEDEDKKQIFLPNWPICSSPVELLAKMVSMESVHLSDDKKSLVGRCQVSNISFEKKVLIRYTFNYWKDTQEIEASYREPCASGDASNSALDRFMFNLPINPTTSQTTIFICIKYVVNGREFWDNNEGRNYQVDIMKPNGTNKKSSRDELPIKSRRALDDSSLEFGTSPPSNSATVAKSKLWNRYDFGASLSAAKRTTTPKYKRVQSFPSYFSDLTEVDELIKQQPSSWPKEQAPKPYQKEKKMTTTATAPIAIPRPAPGTASYFDLVNKYCFYGNERTIYSTSPSYSSSPAIRG
ncbi:unnamed protein product [Umbelopsis vinacea]